ncbi:MAG TPA: hypothetical protein VFV63_12395 [Ilumatobacteraceae bacterium]|nr:hypothetical protein [Ilumatobacteraceae bacterium]
MTGPLTSHAPGHGRHLRSSSPVASIRSIASDSSSAAACGDETADASGTVTVHATDFAFDDLPEEVEPGTTFEFVNDSDVELHER